MTRRSPEIRGFRARLAQIIGQEPPYAWAARVGISKGAFSRIWNQGTVPSSELLNRIRIASGVSIDWLLTGEVNSALPAGMSREEFVFVPLYQVLAAAGTGNENYEEEAVDYVAFSAGWMRQNLGIAPTQAALIQVTGDSMEPTLSEGDLVLVDRSQRKYTREGIYVLRSEGLLLIKRLQLVRPATVRAISDNSAYKPFELSIAEDARHYKIVGRAVLEISQL